MSGSSLIDVIFLVAAALSGVFVLLLPLELWGLWHRRRLTRARVWEMLASASPLIPTLLADGLVLGFVTWLFGGAAKLAPWTLPVTWWSAALAVIVVDFLYYWDHRVAHRVRLVWAVAHSVHHSSPQYDQTTGLRVSFVDGFTSPWFYVPAVLIGFHPALVGACFLLILGYQQWLHTESVGRLRWLDGWLNTPSNHRVHHGAQGRYLDRNFGAVLIVWDRCFGTYAPETEPVRYGLTAPLASSNPLRIHVHEAVRLWRDLASTARFRDRLTMLWRGPEWRPPVAPVGGA